MLMNLRTESKCKEQNDYDRKLRNFINASCSASFINNLRSSCNAKSYTLVYETSMLVVCVSENAAGSCVSTREIFPSEYQGEKVLSSIEDGGKCQANCL
jgi:hypothetical protein